MKPPNAVRAAPFALVAASVLVGLLAGCVSMKGLQTQGSLTAPDRLEVHHSLAGVNLTPAAWPRADWWTALGDPRLDGLVREALTGSPTLDAVDARVRVALAQAGAQDAARKAARRRPGRIFRHLHSSDGCPAALRRALPRG